MSTHVTARKTQVSRLKSIASWLTRWEALAEFWPWAERANSPTPAEYTVPLLDINNAGLARAPRHLCDFLKQASQWEGTAWQTHSGELENSPISKRSIIELRCGHVVLCYHRPTLPYAHRIQTVKATTQNSIGLEKRHLTLNHPLPPQRSYLPIVKELHKPLLRFLVLVEFHGQVNSKWGPFLVKNPQGQQHRQEGYIMCCIEVHLSARRKWFSTIAGLGIRIPGGQGIACLLWENNSRSKGQLAVSWAGLKLLWSRWWTACSHSHVSRRRTTPGTTLFASAFLPTHLFLPWWETCGLPLYFLWVLPSHDWCSSYSWLRECRRVTPAPCRFGNFN